MKHILLVMLFLIAMSYPVLCQERGEQGAHTSNPAVAARSPELFDEIAHMDSLVSVAFNTQNLDQLRRLFTSDLEFYQDNEGLALYSQTINDFRKMFEQGSRIRRELVKGSLEVYPIKDYGAIEVGVHKFCHDENGKEECGSFKFVHIWRKKGSEWRICRVVSYGH
jgi:hypothetical protein